MFKNSNNASVKKLSNRSIKANKTRNIFAILAIILTTVMFITVTTLVISIIDELNFEDFRRSGTTAHGYVKNPTKGEIENIKNSSLVKKVGEATRVTKNVEHPKIDKAKITLCYLDSEALSMRVYDDLKGAWPNKENEIALPTWALDKLGLSHTLGQKITLGYEPAMKNEVVNAKDSNKLSKEFTLSAYYTEYTNSASGDSGFGIVSKAFRDNLGGASDLFIGLKKSDNVEINFERVCSDAEIDSNRFSINKAYTTHVNRDITDMIPFGAMIIIILACGYLIIYNIFYISVSKDIKFYGLLKTIGTTSKQLKVIVKKQCLRLCIIGIPIGVAVGYGISFIVVPLAMRGVNVSKFKVSFNPLIFILTIIFTLITVILACRKPAKLAGKVSPIEALRFSSVDIKRKSGVKNGSKGAKVYKMAWANVFRDKKRAIIVLLSLTLGFTCFVCAATFSKSLQADAYLERYVLNDFEIENKLLTEAGVSNNDKEDYIDEKLYDEISEIEDIKNINRIRFINADLKCEGVLKANSDEFFKGVKDNRSVSTAWSNILGVKGKFFDNMDKELLISGNIDKAKFESGNYVVLAFVHNDSIKVGDKINIGIDSKSKIVEVMAITRMSTYVSVHSNGPDIFVDENIMKELYPESKTLSLIINVKKGANENVYSKLKGIIGVTSNIKIEAKHIKKQEFIKMQNGMFIALGGLSLVIAFIGAINFINTMITSINARKVELAMLEAVGMTNKQMKKMITLEGIYYGLISLFIVGTVGNVMAYYLIQAFKNEADYAKYYFPTIPLIGIAIFVVVMSLLVPKIIFKATMKESIVDRLREVG